MREFREADFPPFLNVWDANHETDVAVETTLKELSEKKIKVGKDQPIELLPARLLELYGPRRVFAIIDFPKLVIKENTEFFIEVYGARDAEDILQALSTVVTVTMETTDTEWHDHPDLEGFRRFET